MRGSFKPYPQSTINIPAIEALVKVEKMPVTNAEIATSATALAFPGASRDKTPIWIPTALMFPKPQRAYVAMRRERGEIEPYFGLCVSSPYYHIRANKLTWLQ